MAFYFSLGVDSINFIYLLLLLLLLLLCYFQVYAANGFMPFATGTSLYRPVKMEVQGTATDWYVKYLCDDVAQLVAGVTHFSGFI